MSLAGSFFSLSVSSSWAKQHWSEGIAGPLWELGWLDETVCLTHLNRPIRLVTASLAWELHLVASLWRELRCTAVFHWTLPESSREWSKNMSSTEKSLRCRCLDRNISHSLSLVLQSLSLFYFRCLLVSSQLTGSWLVVESRAVNWKCCLLEVDKMDEPDLRVEILARGFI